MVIVDPRPEQLEQLVQSLEAYGYAPQLSHPTDWTQWSDAPRAAWIVGPNLPPDDLPDLCASIHDLVADPLLVLMQSAPEDQIARVLTSGADQCLVADLEAATRLLLSALGAVQRRERRHRDRESTITLGALYIDLIRRSAELHGKPLPLTTTEFGVLAVLAQHPREVMRASEIIRQVHGHEVDDADAQVIVKVHISRLRQKLSVDPGVARSLVTVRGRGYMYMFERRQQPSTGSRAAAR
jgi:DNA-binding response OmpR family regulator